MRSPSTSQPPIAQAIPQLPTPSRPGGTSRRGDHASPSRLRVLSQPARELVPEQVHVIFIHKNFLTAFATHFDSRRNSSQRMPINRRRRLRCGACGCGDIASPLAHPGAPIRLQCARKSPCYKESMSAHPPAFANLSDDQLLAEVHRLAAAECRATATLIRSLIELDSRPHLYLRDGCSSLFVYCTQVLHLEEGATYNRIEVARAARRFPTMLEALEDGSVTLTALRLLAPHLTDANHRDVLDSARHQTKADVQRLIASLQPKPDVPAVIRKLPEPRRPVAQLFPQLRRRLRRSRRCQRLHRSLRPRWHRRARR